MGQILGLKFPTDAVFVFCPFSLDCDLQVGLVVDIIVVTPWQEHGYPAYTTQVGWLGYPDDKLKSLCRQFKGQGFTKFKVS